jgi:hypothetical protein
VVDTGEVRGWGWSIVAGLACSLLLVAAVTVPGGPASASATVRARAGFSVGNRWATEPTAELTRDLDAMRAARASWLRLTVSWSNLEPAKGSYAWTKQPTPAAVSRLEEVLRGAAARGMAVIAVVTTTPAWARPAGCTKAACAPARLADYTDFLRAVVGRYRLAPYGVHTWEVWNMPNTTTFFLPAPNAARYVSMLKASYPVIRGADPGATVLSGGLGAGHGFCPSPSSCTAPLSFLIALYDLGAGGTFDGVDLHAVSEDAEGHPVSPLTAGPSNVFAALPSYRKVMVDHGDGGKRIWAEIGYSALDGVSRFQQAQYVSQALQRWVTYPWTSALVVYNFRDIPGEMSGVMEQDGSPKPAYRTFAALTA